MRRVSLLVFLLVTTACFGAPSITSLTLTGNGQNVRFNNGATLEFGVPYTLRAQTNGQTQSVRFRIDSNTPKTINQLPYDCPMKPQTGDHRMVVTPYLRDNGQGKSGPFWTVQFSVVQTTPTPSPTSTPSPSPTPTTPTPTPSPSPTSTPTPTPVPSPSVTPTPIPTPSPTASPTATPSASPTPTATATPVQPAIGELTCNGDTFNDGAILIAGTSYTVTALVSTDTKSVVFKRENGQILTDSTSPYQYTMAGPSVGAHWIEATPWSAGNGTGTSGEPLLINFSVASAATPSPSPTPLPTPTPTPSATTTPTPLPSPTPTPSPTATSTPTPSPSTVSVVASWQATQGDSYKVYYGTATGQYGTVIDAGPSDSFVISGLLPKTTYHFALTSVRNGIESPKSQETVYTTTLSLKQNLRLKPN